MTYTESSAPPSPDGVRTPSRTPDGVRNPPPPGGIAPVHPPADGGGGGGGGETTEERNAKERLRAELARWGLGSLADWAYEQIVVDGHDEGYVFTVLLPQQQAYKDRFSANAEREKEGLRVLSPAEYIAYEESIRGMMRTAGLPRGFYDSTKDFNDLIAADVSPAELQQRLVEGYQDVMLADPIVRRGFAELYGVQGDAALAAYFIDPDRALPVLERQERAARVYGASVRTGYGAVDRKWAETIASLNLTDESVTAGFNALTADRSLFSALDEGEADITQAQQVRAAFEGNANARQRIETRRRRRQAAFEGGGGFATSAEGFAGLGSAEG